MTDPRRLSDDANAPAQLRALLRSAPSAHPLDPAVRERARARALRAAAFPVTAVGWLSVKTAVAALSIGCGTAVVAVIASTPRPVPPPSSKTPANRDGASHKPRALSPASLPVGAPRLGPPVQASEEVGLPQPNPVLRPRARGKDAAFPEQRRNALNHSDLNSAASQISALAAESDLLERARSALRPTPLEALRLAREHAERFPHAQLAAERALIEIEALHRLGRDTEAQGLAQTLLARSADGLYVERVRQLLGELE